MSSVLGACGHQTDSAVRGVAARVLRVLLVVLVSLGGSAQAQLGLDPETMKSPISRRDVLEYAEMLRLDPDQAEAARVLLGSYRERLQDLAREQEGEIAALEERARETGDNTLWQKEAPGMMARFAAREREAERVFYKDLASLLTAPQSGDMVRVERHRRRANAMKIAVVAGSRVDLISILDRMRVDVASEPALNDLVLGYEADLDRLLAERERTLKELEEYGAKHAAEIARDKSHESSIVKRWQAVERPVRDLNRRFARQIEEALPAERRSEFRDHVLGRSFPRVYGDSPVMGAINAARGLPDLTRDQEEQLDALRARYIADVQPLNQAWAAAIVQRDDSDFDQVLASNDPELFKSNPIIGPRRARLNFDKQTRAKLEAVLSPAQREAIPPAPGVDLMDQLGVDYDLGGLAEQEQE